MNTLTPILTGTPGHPPSYNVGMAETFSWVPIENDANRPLFARAGYITNLSDMSISLSASDINIGAVEIKDGNTGARASIISGTKNALAVHSTNSLGYNGFVFTSNTTSVYGNFTNIQVISSCKFSALSASNSTINDFSSFELPQNFIVSGNFTGYKLSYGAVIAYKS